MSPSLGPVHRLVPNPRIHEYHPSRAQLGAVLNRFDTIGVILEICGDPTRCSDGNLNYTNV